MPFCKKKPYQGLNIHFMKQEGTAQSHVYAAGATGYCQAPHFHQQTRSTLPLSWRGYCIPAHGRAAATGF